MIYYIYWYLKKGCILKFIYWYWMIILEIQLIFQVEESIEKAEWKFVFDFFESDLFVYLNIWLVFEQAVK